MRLTASRCRENRGQASGPGRTGRVFDSGGPPWTATELWVGRHAPTGWRWRRHSSRSASGGANLGRVRCRWPVGPSLPRTMDRAAPGATRRPAKLPPTPLPPRPARPGAARPPHSEGSEDPRVQTKPRRVLPMSLRATASAAQSHCDSPWQGHSQQHPMSGQGLQAERAVVADAATGTGNVCQRCRICRHPRDGVERRLREQGAFEGGACHRHEGERPGRAEKQTGCAHAVPLRKDGARQVLTERFEAGVPSSRVAAHPTLLPIGYIDTNRSAP